MTNGNTQAHIPTVLWAQREDILYLTIAVEDIEKPEIKLESNNLNFKFVCIFFYINNNIHLYNLIFFC